MLNKKLLTKLSFLIVLFIGFNGFAQNQSVLEEIKNAEEHSIFVEKLQETGILASLEDNTEYTFFAPNNEAMKNIPSEILENADDLNTVLSNHIYEGKLTVEALGNEMNQKGGKMPIQAINNFYSGVYLDGDQVIFLTPKADKINLEEAAIKSDGVIYNFNNVLIPADL